MRSSIARGGEALGSGAAAAPRPVGLTRHRARHVHVQQGKAPDAPPWEFSGLPDGLTVQDFTDAAEALRTGGHCGRVQALPPDRANTSRLYATGQPRNAARIRAAATPPLTGAEVLEKMWQPERHGRPVPAILWDDPSPSGSDVRPLAVIVPTGYAGSIWNPTGTVLTRWVASHREQGWLWATVAFLPTKGTDVNAALPTPQTLGLR